METLSAMEHRVLTNRARDAYYRRAFCGGRSLPARIFDAVALRCIFFVCAYLFFLPRIKNVRGVIALSLVALCLFMLILHVLRSVAYERFLRREKARLSLRLLTDELLLLPMQQLLPLCSGSCPFGDAPVVLQRALPVNANDLCELLRARACHACLQVFSCTPYDKSAREYAQRSHGRIVLHPPEELLTAAKKAGMRPTEEALEQYIFEMQQQQQQRKKRLLSAPFTTGTSRRYVITAAILTALSFVTSYALYYRLLAGVCMTIAAVCSAFFRTPQGNGNIE